MLTAPVVSFDQFGVIVTGVINPPSFQPLTNSFTFLTKTADDVSSYALDTNTPSLSNTNPSAFTNLSGTFSPRTLGDAVTLTVKVTPSSRIVPSTIVVSAPPSFSVTTFLACSSFVGFSGTCDDDQASTHTIEVSGVLTASEMTFTITGLVAPNAVSGDFTTVTSFDANGFRIDQNGDTI